jgi:ribonucleotide reductase beta subunit family protein with ferritin-like domain
MMREAVAIEKHFIVEAIPCRMVGMNAGLMSTYIEYVADGLLTRLGYAPIYGATNPFSFMDLIGMAGRSNFFEERVSLYQRADVMAGADARLGPASDDEEHGGDSEKQDAQRIARQKKADMFFAEDF